MLLAVLTDWCFAVYGCKFDFQKCYQKCYRCYQTEKRARFFKKSTRFFKTAPPFFKKSAPFEKYPMRHTEKSGTSFLYVSFLHKNS